MHDRRFLFALFVLYIKGKEIMSLQYCFLQFTSKIMRNEEECDGESSTVNKLSIKSLVESFMPRFNFRRHIQCGGIY